MRFSRSRIVIAAAALSLAAASLGLHAAGAQAAQSVNLVPAPGTDRAESGYAMRNGNAIQVVENGGVPGARVLFAPCTSTGTQYACGTSSGTVVTLDGSGSANVTLNFNAYAQPIDAVIGTNQADSNDQVIATFNTANLPSAYASPASLPYASVATTASTAQAYVPATTQQGCFYMPLSGFAPSCFYGYVPGIGSAYLSPVSLGVIPGFNTGFLAGYGYYYLPFGSVGSTVLTTGTGGLVLRPLSTQISATTVCPVGYHGLLTVPVGGFVYTVTCP
ncbi:MAG TPA: hypothetical protein VH916_08160 [Dehalococcoidia bacterium]|jgi:hypothetical protein